MEASIRVSGVGISVGGSFQKSDTAALPGMRANEHASLSLTRMNTDTENLLLVTIQQTA